MSLSGLPALLLAAIAPQSADAVAIDQAVAALFAPYSQETTSEAVWDRPIFSREVSELIAHWQAVMPEDEPDALNDGDWLCQCQDWDPKSFAVLIAKRKSRGPDEAETRVTLDLGWGATRKARLILRREEGQWRLDDLYATDFPKGLKRALRDTIGADEASRDGAK